METKDRLELFRDELGLISKPIIREFAEECLTQAPDYVFEDCPSSYGPYHPIDELGADGTIIHTKRVFALAYELSRGFDVEHHRDEICAASLLHDLLKQGLKKSGHTVKQHPQLMAKFAADIYRAKFKGKLHKDSATMICSGIYYHYGPWSPDIRKLLAEYTMEEMAFI
ncbi:hypothetical protein LCGC14_1170850 [marine sediment metagenome]|uniref:HD domain-containing protein n=1 Tax=marine sediment metagenome TaxID=412755 RepID=A0A0F9PVE7_9ZZZZ